MKTYFITRFNIFDYDFKGFQITQNNSAHKYKSEFFNKNRLEFKTSIFTNVTLPSIINQEHRNWEWHIYTSSYLPEKYLDKLLSSIKNYQNIHLIKVENFNEFYDKITNYLYSDQFATVRLDDDDALCKQYIKLLYKYKNNSGSIISFPYGREYKWKNLSIYIFCDVFLILSNQNIPN